MAQIIILLGIFKPSSYPQLVTLNAMFIITQEYQLRNILTYRPFKKKLLNKVGTTDKLKAWNFASQYAPSTPTNKSFLSCLETSLTNCELFVSWGRFHALSWQPCNLGNEAELDPYLYEFILLLLCQQFVNEIYPTY